MNGRRTTTLAFVVDAEREQVSLCVDDNAMGFAQRHSADVLVAELSDHTGCVTVGRVLAVHDQLAGLGYECRGSCGIKTYIIAYIERT